MMRWDLRAKKIASLPRGVGPDLVSSRRTGTSEHFIKFPHSIGNPLHRNISKLVPEEIFQEPALMAILLFPKIFSVSLIRRSLSTIQTLAYQHHTTSPSQYTR
jgi:hypothetical protein